MSCILHCHNFLCLLQTAHLMRSLLPQSPISHGRFSRSRLSLTVASPAATYLSRSLLLQSPISCGRFSQSRVSLTVASPTVTCLTVTSPAVACLMWLLLPKSPVCHGRFSHICLSLVVASPIVAYPLQSLLSRSIFCAHISSSPEVAFLAVTFPAVASLQSHFLQSLVAGLGWM